MEKKKILILSVYFILIFIPISQGDSSNAMAGFSVNDKYNVLNISPEEKTVYVPPAKNLTDIFDLKADYPGNTGLNITITREGSSWITFDGNTTKNVSLASGESKIINFTVAVPNSTPIGLYFANITAQSGDGQLKKLNLTINVTEDVGKLNISVNDSIGNTISGASIFIWQNSILKDTGSTDSNGNFLSKWLVKGSYVVEATKAGYSNVQKNAMVEGNRNTTNVFITLEPTGAPVLDVSPSSISESAYTGNQVSKILIISNTGDMVLSGVNLYSDVEWISFSQSYISSIAAGDSKNVYAYLGPLSQPGEYTGTIYVNSSNDGSESIPVIFDVETSEGGGGGGGGGATGGTPTVEIKKSLKIVNYPNEVNISKGEKKLIGIEIKNDGEVSLNVSLNTKTNFPTKVSPEFSEMLPGSTKVFLVRVNVPEDAELGNYDLLIRVSGDGISLERIINLRVVSETGGLEEDIENLKSLIDKIWEETVEAGTKGYNVTEVFNILKKSKESLEKAEDLKTRGYYENVTYYLNQTRTYLEKAAMKLGEMKIREIPVFPLKYKIILIVVVIGAIVLVILFRKRFRRTLKRMKRLYNIKSKVGK
ncbi:MAG: hypothetical protein J7K87_02020 [Candidatus Aenigmarchaeota archaeon]|nr:hypothetical protein [Candidatus Aenigmarchaeota archaeon]